MLDSSAVVGSDSLSPSDNSSTRTEQNHVTVASSLVHCDSESPRVDSPSTAPV